ECASMTSAYSCIMSTNSSSTSIVVGLRLRHRWNARASDDRDRPVILIASLLILPTPWLLPENIPEDGVQSFGLSLGNGHPLPVHVARINGCGAIIPRFGPVAADVPPSQVAVPACRVACLWMLPVESSPLVHFVRVEPIRGDGTVLHRALLLSVCRAVLDHGSTLS